MVVLIIAFFILAVIGFGYFAHIVFFVDFVHWFFYSLETSWHEWFKLILTTAVGGVLSYFYVVYREDKKDIQGIQAISTRVLLNTQIMLMFQISEVRTLTTRCNETLNLEVRGQKLGDILNDLPSIPEKSDKLSVLIDGDITEYTRLLPATNQIVIAPIANRTIILPYEIFDLRLIKPVSKKLPTGTLTTYMRELSRCNRIYLDLVAIVERQNEIRNLISNNVMLSDWQAINQDETKRREELGKKLLIVAAMVDSAFRVKRMTTKYFQASDKAFLDTSNYINSLGLSPPIPFIKDEYGHVVFEKMEY